MDYHNEIDAYAAQWIRNLMDAELIPRGHVDERDIRDVRPSDLAGYDRCHFFSGIAGWAYALRLAGVRDDRPGIWTGSCSCKPFSAAGQRKGAADERHLWPAWFKLTQACRPECVLGEQVEAAIRQGWLDAVLSDLEGEGYACGAVVLPACGVGAPHIRQRLWFVADAADQSRFEAPWLFRTNGSAETQPERLCNSGLLVDAAGEQTGFPGRTREPGSAVGDAGLAGGGRNSRAVPGAQETSDSERVEPGRLADEPLAPDFWRDCEWVDCVDEKRRPVEPGTFPLFDGVSASLERMRAIKNRSVDEIKDYAERSKRDADEVLRILQQNVRETKDRKKRSIGVRQELHEEEVLLNFLLCVDATFDRTADNRGVEKTISEEELRILRSMWSRRGNLRSSHRRESDEQSTRQPPNSLHDLSQLLACDAQAYWTETRNTHAGSLRADKLRALGNSIVPQAAAAFIRAALS